MINKLIFFGYSGHSYEIINIMIKKNYVVEGYFDKIEKEKNPFGLNYLGFEDDHNLKDLIYDKLLFTCIGENKTRLLLSDKMTRNNGIFLNVVHPSALVSEGVVLGNGNFIAKNSSINFNSIIGNQTIINTSSIIEHDCIIEDGAHIGPGTVICGGVTVKKGAFVGANSIVKENLIIGENSVIGAGSVVLKNIPKNTIAYGNPSKLKK